MPLLIGIAIAAVALLLLAPIVRPALAPAALVERPGGAPPRAGRGVDRHCGRAAHRRAAHSRSTGHGRDRARARSGRAGSAGSGHCRHSARAGSAAAGASGGGLFAGPGQGGIGGLLDASAASPDLVAALQGDAADYTWTAATTGSNNAAGLALSSETSVMAIGGFNGSDPSPTLEQFQADVAAGQIHYYVATRDAAGFRGTQGGSNAAAEIAAWVEATFAPTTIGGVTVYDLSAR